MKKAPPLFVGRQRERAILEGLWAQNSSELVSITGRRRVGKTFLIKEVFRKIGIDFKVSGLQNGSKQEQMLAFELGLAEAKGTDPTGQPFANWQMAFVKLIGHLKSLEKEEKIVVFLDELPWLATPRSGFLRAFSFFWNNWAVDQNIMVIICGSAASWMIQKVVRDKGGLHNRITQRIQLEPFTLRETREYLHSKNFSYSDQAITELYMALGGIPFYLRELSPDLSVAQNIDQQCFARAGSLYDEFSRLYPALFERAERHMEVVRVLAAHHYGMDRQQIITSTTLSDGGGLSKTLEELEFSGFIVGYYSFHKKKRNRIFRLVDEYSLFYLRFVEKNKLEGSGTWEKLSQLPNYKTWSGYAFENVGLRHLKHIKKALGISGVYTTTSTFYHSGSDQQGRLQIDLIIDRADKAINLCEFKFYSQPIAFTPSQLQELEARKEAFRSLTRTDKTLFTSLISTKGLAPKTPVGGVINQSVTLEAFFEEA